MSKKYITLTSSERIVDTLEFFPHNYPMPQISSIDRLLMTVHAMTDALKHPHPDVTFSTIGDDTIMALTTLAAIFKNKYKKPPAPVIIDSPIEAAENKRPVVLIQPVIISPVKHNYQTRSQTEVNQAPADVSGSQNLPQLPRVVTPAARSAAPPRVPARAHNLSPRNFSQGDLLDMGSTNNAIASRNNNWSNVPMMNAILHPATYKEMQYNDIIQHPTLGLYYKTGFGNELGRLCQGIRDIQGTHTWFFVELTKIPKYRKITYCKLVCDYKPDKTEKERVKLTVGGDGLYYTGDVATSTADITTFKMRINSTLSTKDAEMIMMDIKKYYLGKPLPRYEYMRLPLSIILDEIVTKYNLQAISVVGWVYLEIKKGMYNLKQAGIFTSQCLQKRLTPYGYYPACHTPWNMATQNKANIIHTCCG
jgi:hypothetical protein